MLKKVASSITLILLLLGVLLVTFSVETAKADQESGEAGTPCGLSLVRDLRFAGEQTSLGEEGLVGQPRIAEHRISASELEKMKQEIGVCEDARNCDHTVNGHGAGLRPPTEEEWTQIAASINIVETVTLRSVNQPPSRVDYSTSPWFPPIGNQDGESSCVAWAVGYYMKTFQEAKEHGWNLTGARWQGSCPTPEYQDKIISPAFIYHLINSGVNSWTSYYDAINVVCSIGACSWTKMPWNSSDQATWPSENAWQEAAYYRGASTGYESMSVDTDGGIQSLKNWIASENFAVIGVDAYQYSSLTSNDVWTADNYAGGSNHANTIVGYDDNFTYLEGGQLNKGAFKIANSWGVGGWEKIPDGFYWISYKAMSRKVGYVMFYRDRIGYAPTLTCSFKIAHSMRGDCSIVIGMGTHDNPTAAKSFTAFIIGGNQPFCPNNIVFDITEFEDAVPNIYGKPFFLSVYDGLNPATGTILYFSVEDTVSSNPPVTTVNGGCVFADLTLEASSMWVEPSTASVPGVVGYRFNVTVWANISRPCYTWQFTLNFNSNYFAATRTGYTAGSTSAFFIGHSTIPVTPIITSSNVSIGESLIGTDSRTAGSGSLAWVEFEVKAVSSQPQILNITNTGSLVLDTSFNVIPVTFSDATVTFGPASSCLVVRGEDNRIYYRAYDYSTDSWTGWNVLSGATCDSPAAAVYQNKLYIVVRGMDGNTLWCGSVDLSTYDFSGWSPLDGATPSAPTLTSNGTVLCLVVRGMDNRIYYRCYSGSWGSWQVVSTGATCDSPAAAMLGNDLHIVVRGMDGNSLWDIIVRCDGTVVRNWGPLSGATHSKPVLACSGADSLCLVVRGIDNRIYYRNYTGSTDSWADWNALPGATIDGPAATAVGNMLCTMVRGSDGNTLWRADVNLDTSSFTGWTLVSGATPSAPTLTS